MSIEKPRIRKDLEFSPVRYSDKNLVLIRDQLGLVPEGKAVDVSFYQFLMLLDGSRDIRDLQIELMRQKGGVLVATDEVKSLLADLDESFLLDSSRYRAAKDRIVSEFSCAKMRPCFLGGRGYPKEAQQLTQVMDSILQSAQVHVNVEGRIKALMAPHIDLSVGSRVYAGAYTLFRKEHPSRVILLGTGHYMSEDMFCLTEKDFETPLGIVKNDAGLTQQLKRAGAAIISSNDFSHRCEHSIEFQLLFLQHLLGTDTFSIIPILCGPLMTTLPSYDRDSYRSKAGVFLSELKRMVEEGGQGTVVIAGVDLSHIGLKFGHNHTARFLADPTREHDQNLLNALSEVNPELLWKESIKVQDQYNVCGFPVLACLLEILPLCKGKVLDYDMWFEEATRSAVSFASAVFTI